MNLNKIMEPKKTLEEMEKVAKEKHMVKMLQYRDGALYASFHEPGKLIRDQRGRVYQVREDGSIRRVKR
jgi:hypothetical protein